MSRRFLTLGAAGALALMPAFVPAVSTASTHSVAPPVQDAIARSHEPGAMPAGAAPKTRDITVGWQKLKADKNGLRHVGKWTIYPNGIQTAPNSNESDCPGDLHLLLPELRFQ